jgi:hypothetical protein
MNALERRRLRAPLFTAACGLVLTVAVLVVVGWTAAAPVAAVTAVSAIAYYVIGGTDTDVGALIGSRADERQSSVRLWVRAFAAPLFLAMGTIGAVVSAILHRPAWPYALIVGLGAAAFLCGLALYWNGARLNDSGFGGHPGSRLDERQVAILLHALQLAAIVMFLASALGGVALTGTPGAAPLRILASAFAVALVAGFAIFRPGNHVGTP